MGPSVVLSSAMANKADWEREAGALNSSNEEEEEGDYEQSPHLAHYHGPAVAAFGTPTLLYQHQPTASNQTPYSDQRFHQHLYELDPDQYAACNAATVAASIGAADTTSVYPYIPSPAPMRQEEYLPSSFYAFGAAQKHIKQEAGSDDDDDEDDDDRKPAARKESVTKISPHRKKHSLSKDPFDESPAESVHEPSAVPDQFINPSMSFGDDDDDDDVRNQQGHHFDMPRWSAAADPSVQMGYAAPAPLYAPPLAFTLGDRFPRHSPPPPQLQDSPALHIATPTAFVTRHAAAAQQPQQQQQQQRGRGGPKPRVLLPQPQRKPPPPPPLVHHHCIRREPTAVELAALGTERAKAALVTWYERYNELVAYLAEHGDCNVPQKYPPNPQLGIWVNKQRMEKKFMEEGQKKSSMSEEKVQALESIGFAWAKRKGEASWMIKYNELKRFVAEHGHCDVATKYQPNPALGRWVSTQRSEYKALQRSGRSRHMTQAKINMLNGLKFKWEMLPQRSSGSSNSSSNNSNNDGSSSGGED